jgi:cell wall-associated NlpC family hydrolase
LPSKELEDKTWAISCLSVANGREEPEQKAELGTQVLMGHTVRVWKQSGRWYLVQTKDGYLSWAERGSLVRCTEQEARAWESGPLLIVTALENQMFEKPETSSQPVSDIVLGNLLKKIGESGDWFQVQLPDQRQGFVSKKAVEDFRTWKKSRKADPDIIERTARLFLGRPYLWGGNSPKGLDCSGLTKTVFFVNGIDLNRNASHQALQGKEVKLDPELSHLKKGDLLFFGHARRESGERRVSHVAIYLGNKTFIQSSQRVRISSLDPASPLYDEQYGHSLLAARRVLK